MSMQIRFEAWLLLLSLLVGCWLMLVYDLLRDVCSCGRLYGDDPL